MHHFSYIKGRLHAENVNLQTIISHMRTPFYCYCASTIQQQYAILRGSFAQPAPLICYAMKANSNQSILRILALAGAGMDIVSGGELYRALCAGVPGKKIIFSGVGKQDEEIRAALAADILCFNVESRSELERIERIAAERSQKAPVSIRINPDINPGTHDKIATGGARSKFGNPLDDVEAICQRACQMRHIRLSGLSMHIGSQITHLEPFQQAFSVLIDKAQYLRSKNFPIERLDFGGGWPILYKLDEAPLPSPADYAHILEGLIGKLSYQMILEPGRLLVGHAGILVTQVVTIKKTASKTFVVTDSGMNDLIRPTLYDAHHDILPLVQPMGDASCKMTADIVGPVCETGDYFALEREIDCVREGDYLAVMSVGAYGAVQSNTYNSRLLVPEVLVDGDRWAIVRRRRSYEDLVGLDDLPEWLR